MLSKLCKLAANFSCNHSKMNDVNCSFCKSKSPLLQVTLYNYTTLAPFNMMLFEEGGEEGIQQDKTAEYFTASYRISI